VPASEAEALLTRTTGSENHLKKILHDRMHPETN
jgi:hypothetical protein